MQPASPTSDATDRLLRVSRSHPLASGSISKLNHLLLVADPHPASQDAIDLAVELTEQFNPRLTLMHGGGLQCLAGGWTNSSQDDPDQRKLALLCLLWQLRQRCPEIGMCTVPAYRAAHVLEAATQGDVDLLVLPEGLFQGFLPLVSGSQSLERVAGAPCPVVVVEDQAHETFAPDGSNFR